jgi:hypothetical protein
MDTLTITPANAIPLAAIRLRDHKALLTWASSADANYYVSVEIRSPSQGDDELPRKVSLLELAFEKSQSSAPVMAKAIWDGSKGMASKNDARFFLDCILRHLPFNATLGRVRTGLMQEAASLAFPAGEQLSSADCDWWTQDIGGHGDVAKLGRLGRLIAFGQVPGSAVLFGILQAGFPVNTYSPNGEVNLLSLAAARDPSMLAVLIENGASLEWKNHCSRTALHACFSSLRLLDDIFDLSSKPSDEKVNQKDVVLPRILKALDCYSLLVRCGADEHASDALGKNPLQTRAILIDRALSESSPPIKALIQQAVLDDKIQKPSLSQRARL